MELLVWILILFQVQLVLNVLVEVKPLHVDWNHQLLEDIQDKVPEQQHQVIKK